MSMPKRTDQNLIVRIGKSEVKVTWECCRYCTVEADYTEAWSIARPLCESRASCQPLQYNHHFVDICHPVAAIVLEKCDFFMLR